MGLDGLTGIDKIKAETANITYESTCVLIRLCHRFNIAVSVENPENLALLEDSTNRGTHDGAQRLHDLV